MAVLWAGLLTLLAVSSSPPDAAVRIERRRAGPYQLEAAFYDGRIYATRPMRFSIRVIGVGADRNAVSVTAAGLPGPETPAVATRPIRLRPFPEVADRYDGALLLSVLGAWELEVRISGAAGAGATRIPVAVSAARVVPPWVGWAVGLSPLLALAWFAAWQRRYLQQLRREERQRPSPSPLPQASRPVHLNPER